MKKEFKASINRALNDANLTGALGKFSEAYKVNRAKAYEGIDFEALRATVADAKSRAACHLDEVADTFKANAEALGAKVFRTRDPQEVKRYILQLAKEKGVKSVVKSKSMATEEIHLNKALLQEGISVAETDLGEWIIQLAGQTPSHMVMPAIHMTKEEVAEIFSKEVDERLSTDIPRLVKVARNELRPKFLAAEMGISGGNIAVAETGSIVLVTNEGNARLVTTLPKIHVALVGVEKLVEKFESVAPILDALPRSATAQLLTSYVSIITGPTLNDDGSEKELHIILMDNRRTEMAQDPKFKQALQCIRCGSCLNVCPIFRLVGGHVFGSIYTGGIGTILTAWFDELKKSEEIQGLCIQCGNCKEVCPGKLDIPEMIMEIRRRLVVEKGQPLLQKAIFGVVNNRKLFHGMLRAASVAGKPFSSAGFIRHLPLFLADLTDGRSLPAIAEKPFRDIFPEIEQPQGKEKAVFYAGCLIDFAYPETGIALVKLLNKAGIEVLFPEEQTCCGAPALYNGAYEVAAQNAVDNIEALLQDDAQYVVSACPTCTVALAHEFGKTLETLGQTEHLEQARQLAAKTVDLATLVKRLTDEGRLSFEEGEELGKITYHDSCHLKRTLRVSEEPRELLQKAGYQLEEMFECDTCCGMGGSYSMKLPEISAPILKRKLQNIKDTGAPVVAMDCPGCVMQIRGGFDQQGGGVKVKHTAELLAERLKG
ncbi:Predicted L-lactate dehydrogenase, Fe-S oxidoreductase subunit YkgE / Predicted L-lactate dehydrogenase, Iron-sulfur cluster-binding subunit YkgF [Citrifermentans bremense]|uniref:Predicted L-lactate dehydrogenase, Fe-S oxidoreductase subunit YkgE / Predicted L-lactate dehydrogenase, Iron-sulfur cluster-binding subunit YkgF n=1 Tax=Citrifermentans bremense TaxID=60035 RepID=A0A6S6LWX4_9BACT|nr:LUD domain-containing protein [Citrifermentans bremense]BCG46537.1 Predicted L-lactate dehydrogenase, Fe-S oxidoreductase subunit YkgE / Predicted L-lactate dehydrogenase, Iron-sulfur cluster-binding subunit YkgF [Citrifermentans bremense]